VLKIGLGLPKNYIIQVFKNY